MRIINSYYLKAVTRQVILSHGRHPEEPATKDLPDLGDSSLCSE